METKLIKISDLKFADYNPRTISKENFERLRRSIKEFGVTVPNTINSHPGRENVIIAGHMRTRAAEAEGMTEMPCYIVNLDSQKERLLNIALNSSSLAGEWNEEMLADMLVRLNEDGADLTLSGLSEDELRVHLGIGEVQDSTVEQDRFDVLTIVPPESPKIKEAARIYCDSIEQYRVLKEAVESGALSASALVKLAEEKV